MQEDVFFEVSDEFINLANDLSDEWAGPMLAAAFMHASARFNVFHVLATTKTKEEEQKAVDYLTDQFRKMVVENMTDIKNDPLR